MADYDIFREQLAIKYPSYGHALWEPSPRNPDRPVQVGDVGYIRRGNFHRLFNALLPAGHPSHEFGVPEYHEPLVPRLLNHLHKDYLDRNNYCSVGVNVKPVPGYHSRPGNFPQVSLQHERTRRAAVLSLPVRARREDTLAEGDFGRWIAKHIDNAFAFARGLGLGIERMEEIILVTGCDRTRSWTNVAFLENQVSFGVKVEVEGHDTSINFQSLPENARGVVLRHGPEGKNLPENQCVFIRGFRASRSLPRHLKAAVGSSSGYGCDPGTEVISTSAITKAKDSVQISKYRDPLHLLLDYMAKQASDCDMMLVHDNDLVTINGIGHGTLLETLEPDVMVELLRRSNIEIHKVLCDSSPTNRLSAPNSDVANVKVAMLSMTFQSWNTAFPSQRSPLVAQNVDISYTSDFRGTTAPASWNTDSPSQQPPLVVQNIDIGHTSDFRGTPAPAVPSSLLVPITREDTREDTHSNEISISSNAGAFAKSLLNALTKQLPSSQEKEGDEKLDQARQVTNEFESVIGDTVRKCIEDKITQARDMKERLNAKSGISRFLPARQYRKVARDAYRLTKYASDRGMDTVRLRQQNQHQSEPSEDIYSRVIKTARTQYRCFLSCKDAFPSTDMKEELANAVWKEACAREGCPDLLCQCPDEEFVYSSMGLLTDIRMKIEHTVESLYEFNTSRDPDSISHNEQLAQALLTKMRFVYGEPNSAGRPNQIYRHPIIQKVINVTWFQNKDSDGIVFREYFTSIPVEVIALALTVIECCIDEWSDGTWKVSNWGEERYEACYRSHINMLKDLCNHSHQLQNGDLLAQIQCELFNGARIHAGAPPDPITRPGTLAIEVLNAVF